MSTLIVRKLVDGDPDFGKGMGGFLATSAATAQKCACRVRMILGEWFLDINAGVPWLAMPDSAARTIIGEPNIAGYAEGLIKQAIMNTAGVSAIEAFHFSLDHNTRAASVYASVTDEDGAIFDLEVSLP